MLPSAVSVVDDGDGDDAVDLSGTVADAEVVMDLGGEPSAQTLSQLSTQQSPLEVESTAPADLLSRRAPAGSKPKTTNILRKDQAKSEKICYFYRKGICTHGRKGQQCKYRHPNLCHKFKLYGNDQSKGCTAGSSCSFLHPVQCNQLKQKGHCSRTGCQFFHPKRLSDLAPTRAEKGHHGVYYQSRLEKPAQRRNSVGVPTRPGTTYAEVTASAVKQATDLPQTQNIFLEQLNKDFHLLKMQMQRLAELVQGRINYPMGQMGQVNQPWSQNMARLI